MRLPHYGQPQSPPWATTSHQLHFGGRFAPLASETHSDCARLYSVCDRRRALLTCFPSPRGLTKPCKSLRLSTFWHKVNPLDEARQPKLQCTVRLQGICAGTLRGGLSNWGCRGCRSTGEAHLSSRIFYSMSGGVVWRPPAPRCCSETCVRSEEHALLSNPLGVQRHVLLVLRPKGSRSRWRLGEEVLNSRHESHVDGDAA